MKKSRLSKAEFPLQAEEKLNKKKQAAQPEGVVDIQRIVHELEAQNEELAQTRAELEAALRQYTDLYDFAPVGYFTLGIDGTILQANLAGANLLGVEHHELTRRRLGTFVSSESLSAFNAFFEKLLSGEGKETRELAFEKKGDEPLWTRLEASCFEGGEVCRAMLTDLTARKRMASLLQARIRISELVASHTFDELLQKSLDEAEILTDSQIGFIQYLEADQKTLKLQMWSTNTLENMRIVDGKREHLPVDQAGVWADCVSERAPLVHNAYADLVHGGELPQGHVPIVRELIVPVVRNDLVVMIMGIGNKPTDYNDFDVEIISQLANSAWDVAQRKQAEQALEAANLELQTALAREQLLARTDPLTGVSNRRYLYEFAEHEFGVATRYQQPLSVIMFDIDRFKKVNDIFGHMAGDQMLERVTQVASSELRSADVIGRYGGEEFIILLPMTTAQQAYSLAERIRMEVAALRVSTPKGNASVTLSIGIVEMMQGVQAESVENVFRRVDEAMYAAKQAGRNRTEIGDQ